MILKFLYPINFDPQNFIFLGIPFVLSKEEYEKVIKDQRVNKQNVAHKWKDFVDNELIVKMGYMEKKRGLFPRRRMFLLTGKNLIDRWNLIIGRDIVISLISN